MISNFEFESTVEFRRAPKKNCFKHYAWEKIRRAEIDLELVREYLKFEFRRITGLMLHSTYNCEIINNQTQWIFRIDAIISISI